MTQLPKLGMGVREVLLRAIRAHLVADSKVRMAPPRPPKRFELHPAIVMDLRQELRPAERFEWMRDPERPTFCGVEVRVDALARRPKMITAENVVEYL